MFLSKRSVSNSLIASILLKAKRFGILSILALTTTLVSQPLSANAQSANAQISVDGSTATEVKGNIISPTGQGTVNGGNLYNSFDRFNVPNSGVVFNTGTSSVDGTKVNNIINRVTGDTPSNILGTIESRQAFPRANLYLLNPNGVVFGVNARLDIGGSFHTTTGTGLSFDQNQKFNVDKNSLSFPSGDPKTIQFGISQPAAIINQGNLTVDTGKNISLTAGTVINTGNLTAPAGNVNLAAVSGNSQVELRSPDLVLGFAVNKDVIPSTWNGEISTLPKLAESLTGKASQANQVVVKGDGTISLVASPSPSDIVVKDGMAIASGNINVSSDTAKAGNVGIFGNQVGLVNSQINASGATGGGTVLIGGAFQGKGIAPNAFQTYVDQNSKIFANGLLTGNGGKVIIWADRSTQFFGAIAAKGGEIAGNGGFVEVSGKENLDYRGFTNTLATFGNIGTLLLDPTNITVVNTGGSASLTNSKLAFADYPDPPNPAIATLDSAVISSATSNVVLQATADINFSDAITIAANGVGLTAQAGNSINVNSPIRTTGGSVKLIANDNTFGSATGAGNITVFAAIDTTNIGAATGGAIDLQINNAGQISVNAPLISGAGNITLNANGSSIANARGINIGSGSNISSTSGAILLNGNVSGTNARGINIGGNSTITSTSGAISFIGISTGAAGDDGVQIEPILFGNTTIQTNGNIAITGKVSNPSRLGVNIPNGNGTLTIDSGSGNLTVTSDKSAFPNINLKGSGTITLQPYSNNVALVIDGNTTNFSGGTTNVNVFADSSFLNTLVASPNFSNVVIGNATTSNAITVASPLTINAKSAPIAILGDTITVNGVISSASAHSLTLDATNNIAINNILDVTGSGSFTAKAINNINVNGSQLTTRAGALTLTATNGNINIPSTTSLGSFTTGDITFTAGNGIALGGNVLSTSGGFIKLIAGNGGINDTATNGINSTAPSGNSGDITIDTTGSIAITNGVISSSTVGNAGNITINALNGNSAVGNLLANTSSPTANAGSLTIKALNITSIGNIDLSAVSGKAGDITLSGNLPLTASTTFSTNSGGTSGNINLGNAIITGNQSLTLNAGSGNVTLGAIATNVTPLTDLTVSGRTILNKDVYTSNFLTFNSPVNLGGNVSLNSVSLNSTAGNITFNNTVDGNKILSLNAGSNFIFFNSLVGGITPLANLSINPASTLASTGTLDITTSGNINTGAIRTFGNSVFLTSNQGDINTSSIATNNFSSQSGNITLKANGNLTTGDIDANGFPRQTYGFIVSGGNVSLTSQTGKISTGDVNTSGQIGGQVFFNARTAIKAGNINSGGLSQAGDVTLDPLGDVVVSSIDTSSLGTGGNVTLISTGGNLRITDSILSSITPACVGASICTTGGETGGNIALQTGGLNPFVVGQSNINGSNGIITTGQFTLSLGTSIPVLLTSSFTQGDISITPGGFLTPTLVPTNNKFEPPSKPDVLVTNNVDDKKILALRDILKKEVDRYLIAGNLEKAFDTIERTYIAELEIFTGSPLDFTGLTLEKTQDLLSTVAQQSGDVAALIYPVLLDNRIEILVIPPKEKGKPFRKFTNAANQEMVEALVSDYRNNIRDVGSNDYLEQSQKLYDLIIRPIDQQLTAMKINTLVFVMDGGLRVTPPAALHDGKQFLIERYAIANVPTIRATRVEERDRKATRVLAMGLTESVEGFSALPSVDIEIKTISSEVLKGTSFLNKDFTISNLQNQRQKGIYSILHLGTHAKFVSDTSQESFIQFWNSRLSLSEIPKLRFDSPAIDMLTLSACQTAVGNNLGISGLAVESGARSVLASLWEVSDSGTAPLMISFYKAFPEAVNKAQAMQQAQIQLLKGKVNIRDGQITGITGFPNIPLPTGSNDINLSHPFYWSSFILVGNWL